MEPQYLDAKKLEKRMNRRALVVDGALATGVGAVTGAAAYVGLTYAKEKFAGVLKNAEKEIRELSLNVKELSGSLEKKLVTERKKLETHYTQGALQIYEDLGIATPAELESFGKIIQNYEEFERQYDFAERAKTFKDRIEQKLLSLDEKIESNQPKFLRDVNDSVRKIFDRPSGVEGKKQRAQIKERLDRLVQIYDTNSNNRIAQGEVLTTLNNYLNQADISKEEKELYSFLKQQYQKEGNEDNLKKFIQNYQNYSGKQEALMQLRASLDEAEKLYGAIKENKQYVTKLQDLLTEGITLKKKVRQTSAQQVEQYKEQIDADINALRSSVSDVIADLKNKGYAIETREDFAAKGTLSRMIETNANPLINAGSCFIGVLATLAAFRERTKTRRVRGLRRALETTVHEHNSLVDYCNENEDQKRISKPLAESTPLQSKNSAIEINKNPQYDSDNEYF